MGYYNPEGYLYFDGMNSEKKMLKDLLCLMNPDVPDKKWELPLVFDEAAPRDFLGMLKKSNKR